MIRFLGLSSVILFTALLGSLLGGSPVNAQSAYDDSFPVTNKLYIGEPFGDSVQDISNFYGGWLNFNDTRFCNAMADPEFMRDKFYDALEFGDVAVLNYFNNSSGRYFIQIIFRADRNESVSIYSGTSNEYVGFKSRWDTLPDQYGITIAWDRIQECISVNGAEYTPGNARDIYSLNSSNNNEPFDDYKWYFSTFGIDYPAEYEGPEVPDVAPAADREAVTEWALHADNDGNLKVNYLNNLPFIARGLTEYELWEANDDWELTTQVHQDDIQPTQGVEITLYETLDANKNYIWLAAYQAEEDGWRPAISAIGFNYTGRPFFMTNQGCTTSIREGSLIGRTYYCNPLDPDTPEANQASGIAQIMTGQDFLSDELNLLIDIATLPVTIIGEASNYRTECVPKNASVMGGQITLPCIENHVRGLGASTVNNMINFVIDMYQTVLLVSVILGTTSISIAVMLNLINPLGSMKMWWPW